MEGETWNTMKIHLFHKFSNLNRSTDFSFCYSPYIQATEFLPEIILGFVCSQIIACQSEFKTDPVPGKSVNVPGWLLLEICF